MVQQLKGRGASFNPANRFVPIFTERDENWSEEDPAPQTQFFKDSTHTILSQNDSPDIPFTYSLNPYRGCEHGCIYCYARPTHEYFGLSLGLDFETKIFVKENAPELLRKKLSSPKWKPDVIAVSGVTDPYQPIERKLALTRKCLEVLTEFLNPVAIVTKNRLVTRDMDILKKLAEVKAVAVYLSITTLDEKVWRKMEPRTASPSQRLLAIGQLSEAGIPVGVLVAPVIPALTDHEMPQILSLAYDSGARFCGYVLLRLPYGVKEIFEKWLEESFPLQKKKILNQIRALRGGKLNDPNFSSRMKGEGLFAEQLEKIFRVVSKKLGYSDCSPELSTLAFRSPKQMTFQY